MTRKTTQLLSSFLTCVIIALCLPGCDKSESEKAADQAKEIISNSNRMIKASSDKAALTQQEMSKVEKIPANANDAMLNQQRQRIAEDVTSRITNAVGEFPFEDINAKIEELKTKSIQSTEDFDAVCSEMITLTNQIIEYSHSYSNALDEINGKKLDSALAELNKANSPLAKAPTEQGRRNSLKNASNLALASIYLTKARDTKAKLSLSDTNVHPILLNINSLIHEVRKCNIDIAAAKSSKPVKAIEGLTEQLTSAKQQLQELTKKINESKSQYGSLEAEYNEYMKKAAEFRDKYLAILNQADKAEGSEKYKLNMQATVQRVGTANMKNWAQDWIEQGKDTEMETFINSSAEITGGIHYETKAELVKLQLNSIKTQIDYFTSLSNNTENRIIQLENVITKLKTSPETTSDIDARVVNAEKRKKALTDAITTAVSELSKIESQHKAAVTKTLELYENAKQSISNYASLARGFGEFDPSEITNILLREMQHLASIDSDFYNSTIGVLDSIKSVPELSDSVVNITDDFTSKAAAAQKAAEQVIDGDSNNSDGNVSSETENAVEETEAAEETEQDGM